MKMSKEESGSADFLERRRAALERYSILDVEYAPILYIIHINAHS